MLKCDEDVRAQLGRLPPKLGDLYLEIYDRLISNSGEFGRAIIENSLKWLLCAQGTLKSSEFLWAVVANLEGSNRSISCENLLDFCNNLVLYDKGLDVFRFAHLSVREFLEKRPECSQASCNHSIAESSLMQIIASSVFPDLEYMEDGEGVLRLRVRLTNLKKSVAAAYLRYANDRWALHCRLATSYQRSDNTLFGRMFRFFLLGKPGPAAPLHTWARWCCNQSPQCDKAKSEDPKAQWKLKNLLSHNVNYLSRSFFVAIMYGFGEVIAACLRNRGVNEEEKGNGLLLAAMAAQHDAFDILMKQEREWIIAEPVLFYALRNSDKERLIWLLDKISKLVITKRMILAVAESGDDRRMAVLLDRDTDFAITEDVLEDVMATSVLSAFRLLVARAGEAAVTEKLLLQGYIDVYRFPDKLDKMRVLLERAGKVCLTPGLIDDVMSMRDVCGMDTILQKVGSDNVTESLMVAAVCNGCEMLELVLHHGGQTTDQVLDVAAEKGDAKTWQVLLERSDVSEIDIRRLRIATKNYVNGDATLGLLLDRTSDSINAREVNDLLCELILFGRRTAIKPLLCRAVDIELSEDILVAAAMMNSGGTDVLRKFLGHGKNVKSSKKVTQKVLLAAAGRDSGGSEIMQFFLDQIVTLTITEDVLTVARAISASKLYRKCLSALR